MFLRGKLRCLNKQNKQYKNILWFGFKSADSHKIKMIPCNFQKDQPSTSCYLKCYKVKGKRKLNEKSHDNALDSSLPSWRDTFIVHIILLYDS